MGTIRNIANVCCVQFSAHSTHLLAFGSADYRTYCFDLRNTKAPWCVLGGHEKAVSYVKFLDSETLVSASTDNTLKLWDLNRTNPTGLSTNACSLTLKGHTNEKVCLFFSLQPILIKKHIEPYGTASSFYLLFNLLNSLVFSTARISWVYQFPMATLLVVQKQMKYVLLSFFGYKIALEN